MTAPNPEDTSPDTAPVTTPKTSPRADFDPNPDLDLLDLRSERRLGFAINPPPNPQGSLKVASNAVASNAVATDPASSPASSPAPIAPGAPPDAAPSSPAAPPQPPPTLGQCLLGSLTAGGFSFLLGRMTWAMAQSFAAKPIAAKSYWAANIGAAVRTLVVGSCTLATFLFAITALGLLALGVQTALQNRRATPEP